MYSPANFSLSNMTECTAALRRLVTGATNMEEVARQLVQGVCFSKRIPSDGSAGDRPFL